MRRLLVVLFAFIWCMGERAHAQREYYAPGHPLSPTSPKQCSDLDAEWTKAVDVITADHDKCLDVHTREKNVDGAGGPTCSRTACQGLHDIMFRFRREQKAEVEACNQQVDAYQKAEQERKDEEARRKAEEDARRRQAEEAREKQKEAADEARRRRDDAAQRQRELAAQQSAAEAARRAQALAEQQKRFDEESRRRNELRDKLALMDAEFEAKIAALQLKQEDEQKAIADRQVDAMKSAAAPPNADADKLASGIDLSGVSNGAADDDSHLFAINSSTATQVFTEIGDRLQEAGRWVVEQGVENLKDQVSGYFTKGDRAPYYDTVNGIVSDALRSSHGNDLDRGSWLRETVIDKTSGAITDWLHDKSVSAFAEHSDDPFENDVSRGFSAAKIWNVGFGLHSYLTKIHDEALKHFIAGFGMEPPDDAEQSR